MKTKIIFILIAGYLLMMGCSNDPIAEGVTLKMKAVTNQSTINGRTSASDLVFNKILLGVRELEFETSEEDEHENSNDDIDGENEDGEDDNEEIEFKGSFVVDLINGTSTPEFGLAEVQPGLYEEIEIELGSILPNNNSTLIAFTYTPAGGDAVQVEFSTQKEIEFEIENEKTGFQIDANVIHSLLVIIDLDALFSGIDLSTATIDADGIIRINDTSNIKISNQILSSFEEACNAGEDNDYDDEIDGD